MKTTFPNSDTRWIGALLALILLGAPVLRAAADAEPKDHTLFLGLNIMIQDGPDYYRVLDVSNDAALIKVNDQLKKVPFSKINGYRLKKDLKIGAFTASLTHLTGDRAYTPANDPTRIWHNRETQLTGYADDRTASAAGDIVENGLYSTGAHYTPQGALLPNYGSNGGDTGALASQIQGSNQSGMSDDGQYAEKLQEDLDKKLFDAMQVDFEVSSDRRLEAPYAVIVTEFRENEEAKDISRWIYIKPLDPIDSKPTKVHVLQGGFPKGFALGKYEVHLYDGGREVPTSLSENRMAITQGEAYMYTGFQYLSDHKGQSLAAAPIAESAPTHLREDFDTSELNRSVRVRLSKQGEVVGFDAGGAGEIPPAARAVWQRLRFYPALENGKPVPSALDAHLADFVK